MSGSKLEGSGGDREVGTRLERGGEWMEEVRGRVGRIDADSLLMRPQSGDTTDIRRHGKILLQVSLSWWGLVGGDQHP